MTSQQAKQVNWQTLVVLGRDIIRDNFLDNQRCEFNMLTENVGQNNIGACHFKAMSIANTFYNVPTKYKDIRLTIDGDPYTLSIAGNVTYNITTLQTALATAYDALGSGSTLTTAIVDGKLQLSTTLETVWHSPPGWFIYGFSATEDLTTPAGDVPTSLPSTPQLNWLDNIYVYGGQLTGSTAHDSASNHFDMLEIIPVTAEYGFINFHESHLMENVLIRFSAPRFANNFVIQLRDKFGDIIDLATSTVNNMVIQIRLHEI